MCTLQRYRNSSQIVLRASGEWSFGPDRRDYFVQVYGVLEPFKVESIQLTDRWDIFRVFITIMKPCFCEGLTTRDAFREIRHRREECKSMFYIFNKSFLISKSVYTVYSVPSDTAAFVTSPTLPCGVQTL